MHIYRNAHLATMSGDRGFGQITDGALVIHGTNIVYAGPSEQLPSHFNLLPSIDLSSRLVTPGLIDCHTHLVYAGSRAQEFRLRLHGASYADIAKGGGGIFSTVCATRNASDERLLDEALLRLDQLLADGVTTVEIKSGYGLDLDTELRMLRIATELGVMRSVRVLRTFLGAHAIPAGADPDEYIDEVCIPTLEAAHRLELVDAVDSYCEKIAFSPKQVERIWQCAQELGLPLKLHADQLSDQGGAELAARFRALSADHLEYTSQAGVEAMALSGTVAVLLPGAFYFLRESRHPPITHLRSAGVPMALATDSNPGSSPMTSLLLAMNMGATLFGLTPEECLRGVTVNAAQALGLTQVGRLEENYRADLAIWDVDTPEELTYRMGDARLYQRIYGGRGLEVK